MAVIESQSIAAEILEAKGDLQWHRGNMHTHSHWSDGDDYLEMIALWYKDHGYDFLVFTDHNVLPTTQRWVEVDKTRGGRKAFNKLKARFPDWIDERMRDGQQEVRLRTFEEVTEQVGVPAEFLLIQGEELSDRIGKHFVHMTITNVQEVIQPRGGISVFETIQNNVDAAIGQRERSGKSMIIHLNHPNYRWSLTAEDIMRVQDLKFIEVHNGHRGILNYGDKLHASSERVWDILLSQRLGVLNLPVMYGLALDDAHNFQQIPNGNSNPGRGWVMVLSSQLTPESLIESLESGHFYASSGVTLNRIEASGERGLSVEVDPVEGETYTIEFIGTRNSAHLEGKPYSDEDGQELPVTHRYSDEVGTIFKTVTGTEAEYQFEGDELYVRARITSSGLHPNPLKEGDYKQAWVQPVIGPGVDRIAATPVGP